MPRLWRFLKDKRNQRTLTWLGGGVLVVASGLWTAAVFFWQPPPTPPAAKVDCSITANQGQASCQDIVNNGPVNFGPKPAGAP
jgi:hypothetical protein